MWGEQILAGLFLGCTCLTWIGSIIPIKLCTLRAIHLYIMIVITENNNDIVVTCHTTKMTELWNYLFQILVTLLYCLFPSCYAPITAYFNWVGGLVYSYIYRIQLCLCLLFFQSKYRIGKTLIVLPKAGIASGMCFSDFGGMQKITLLKKPKLFCAATLLSAGSINLCLHLNPYWKNSWSLWTEANCFQSPEFPRCEFRGLNGNSATTMRTG